jgi:transcriptional regulator with GAF, ATPase, and Fis domain
VKSQPLLPHLIQSAERAAIWAALESHNHNVTHAARRLGIAVRTLHYKIKRLGLRPLPIKHGPPRARDVHAQSSS